MKKDWLRSVKVRSVSLLSRSQRRVLRPLILQPRPFWYVCARGSEFQTYDGLESSEITQLPYMKFGCPREFLWRVRDCMTKWKARGREKKVIGPPTVRISSQISVLVSSDPSFWYIQRLRISRASSTFERDSVPRDYHLAKSAGTLSAGKT